MEGDEESLNLLTVYGTENLEDEREVEKKEDEVEIEEPIKEIEGEKDEEVKQKLQPLPQDGEEEVQAENETTAQDGATVQQDEASEWTPIPQLTLMVIGKTGVGKSTLINAMLGKKKAKVSQSICPSNHNTIEEHTGTVCGRPVALYDTRGLGDPKQNDKELMNSFKQQIDKCSERLRILICQRFTEKLDNSVEHLAELFAIHFENDYTIWKNCILVLTQANLYDPDSDDEEEEDRRNGISPEEIMELKMNIRMKEWAIKFHLWLKKYRVPEEIIMNMPVCVAGNKRSLKLPLTDNWIETIMGHCSTRVLHFQSARLMKGSQKMAVCLGGTVGAVVGAVTLPVVGELLGITLGSLIASGIAQHLYRKTVSDKEQKEFCETTKERLLK